MIVQQATVTLLRRALLYIMVVGSVGTIVELLLLKHTDGVWQVVPLVLNGVLLLVLVWYGVARSAAAIRALQVILVLCFASSGVGLVQHFRGNLVYSHESNPSLSGRELYVEALMGSTPTLAPGMMAQLALIGLAFAFRHPSLRGPLRDDDVPLPRVDE